LRVASDRNHPRVVEPFPIECNTPYTAREIGKVCFIARSVGFAVHHAARYLTLP